MKIEYTTSHNNSLIEIFSDEGKIFDFGDGTYETYACIPNISLINVIKEIDVNEIPKRDLTKNDETIIDEIIELFCNENIETKEDKIINEILNLLN